MTPKLLALTKVYSVLVNICDILWHLARWGSELEKKRTLEKKQCAPKIKPGITCSERADVFLLVGSPPCNWNWTTQTVLP